MGKVIKIPVDIGDKIYVVPSETNFRLNCIDHKERNKVYEFEVHEIRFSKYGYAVVSYINCVPYVCVCCDDTQCRCAEYAIQRFYGETWFLTKKEALDKLNRLRSIYETN